MGEPVTVTATVTNTGDTTAVETVQLYVRDLVGSRTRPVRELEDFQRHRIEPGDAVKVEFVLEPRDLAFFDGEEWVTEPGRFQVWIAPDASGGAPATFEYVEGDSP